LRKLWSVSDWVLLAYRLPREPSTPRIALWRRLRRVGAVQLVDGLVGLPLDPDNREQLDWAAEAVLEAGGEATVWIAQPATAKQERDLAARMATAVAADYEAVREAAEATHGRGEQERRRTLQRLRRALRAIRARDHFPPPEREAAIAAVEALAKQVEVAQ
jgi:hypothetical protein